jgi:hypothetical protein
MRTVLLSRRSLILQLLTAFQLRPSGAQAQQTTLDQGIGGTGLARTPTNGTDQGIGGTGVIGTIRRFGSIIVNGLRIAYASDATVVIDGRSATPGDMRIGHVVSVVARQEGASLATSHIVISSEAIGPVERVSQATAVVLGQTVDLTRIPAASRPKAGQKIAVFGRRRTDGVIVATRVEPAGTRPLKVVGPVQFVEGRGLAIGQLALRGVPMSFIGRRTSVEGAFVSGEFVVSRMSDQSKPFEGIATNVVVEDYVDPLATVKSGSGYLLDVPSRAIDRPGLNIIHGTPSPGGPINVSGAHADAGAEGRSPIQPRTGTFEPGPHGSEGGGERSMPFQSHEGGGPQMPRMAPGMPNATPGPMGPNGMGGPGGFGGPGGPGGPGMPGGPPPGGGRR